MTNKNKYTVNFILSAFLVMMCFSTSCTYDYFEDETNYVLYVPKADINKRTDTYKIDEVKLFIYNNSIVEKDIYTFSPFDNNARTKVGNYNQKLFPGEHNVFCFSNIKGLTFSDTQSYQLSHFSLSKISGSSESSEEDYYQEPLGVLLDTKKPLIRFPGPVVVDTAYMEHRYVGRICFAFKNLTNLSSQLTFENIKSVETIAEGVGTVQYLSQITDSIHTRSTRMSENDKMKLTAKLFENPSQGFDFGFQNFYFPSLAYDQQEGGASDEQPISLLLSFRDAANKEIYSLRVDIVDRLNGYKPIILHMNQTLLVKVDGNDVQIITLTDPMDWNPVIDPNDNTNPGGGGLDM